MRVERICPNCGTRNKPKWEFCVRCAQALGDEPDATVALAPPAPSADGTSAWRSWAVGALLIAAAVAAFVMLRRLPADRPEASLFTMGAEPTTQAAPPASAPVDDLARAERLLTGARGAEAAFLLADLVAREPENARARKLYALALVAGGRQEEAAAEWTAVTHLMPGDISARFELARTLDNLGQPDAAQQAYADLLAIAPNHSEALRLSAGLSTRQGKHAEAVALLRRLVEVMPEDLAARQDLAFALEKSGEQASAVEVYAGIVQSMPTASIARSRLAEVLAREGNPERAVALYREGLSLQPTIPIFHRGLGSALERTGQLQAAAAAYREYLRLAPNTPDAARLAAHATQLEKRGSSS
jgi:Flp pilus assembly protein TadD